MPILLVPSGHATPAAAGFPAVTVEVQFTSAAWTDVTPYFDSSAGQQVTTARGSSRVESPVIRYDAGTCSIPLDNTDRRFDPTNLAGPYVSGGKTLVRPVVPVRVSATYAGVTYRLFHGTADSWTGTYSAPYDAQVVLAASDGFKLLAANHRSGKVVYQGPGEDSGRRVTRILDDAGWPSARRNITPGDATLQATLLSFTAPGLAVTFNPPGQPGAGSGASNPDVILAGPWPAGAAVSTNLHPAVPSSTPLDELYLVAVTEMGEMYVDGNGFLNFRNRNGIWTDTRSNTSQATFGDDPAVPTAELPYASLTPAYDDATLWNGAVIANVGGILQAAADAASQAQPPDGNGPHVFDNQNLTADTDFQALGYAQWIVATSKNAELRFAQMTVDPVAQPADLFPQVLGRQIGDRVTARMRPPGGGTATTRDVLIRGISHAFDDSRWLTTWTFQDISNYPQPFVIGDTVNGVIGVSKVGF